MALSDDIIRKINSNSSQKLTNIDHFKTQILLTDAEKELYDKAIVEIDRDLLNEINPVNSKLYEVRTAYQARIDAGCRTDLYWKVVGIGTTSNTFTLEVDQLGNVGIADTITHLSSSGGITTYQPGSVNIGGANTPDNLYGIKYYDQPYMKDIGDTTLGEFVGVVGVGATELAIVSQISDQLIQGYEVGNFIVSGKDGIFAADYNTIVGFGSTTINSNEIESITGISTTSLAVSTILLENNTVGFASLPESDGSYVTFTVVVDPDDEQAKQARFKYSVKFTENPFSPETIGIIDSSTLGAGSRIEIDNSGKPPETQQWKPELKSLDDIKEPNVGGGKIYYKVGFTDQPVDALGNPASKGDTRIIVGLGTVPNPVTAASLAYSAISQSGCSSYNTAITNAESVRDAAESSLSVSDRANAAVALREERNTYSLRIWGLRQSIGGENDEIDRYDGLISYINNQSVI